jgi:hypothetical protein
MVEDKKGLADSEVYNRKMTESKNELTELQIELQNLMVKFGLRALRLYQTGTNVPLKSTEISYLVKYELTSAIADLSAPIAIDAIIKQTKLEWEKARGKPINP